MPIYEFFCEKCNTIYSFLSRRVRQDARPDCPKCGRKRLARAVSAFATPGRAKEAERAPEEAGGPGDARLERAVESLAQEAGGLDENDPKQAAALMRKLSRMGGMKLGEGMEEALNRMEAGEDPDAVEADMGERLDTEEPFESDEGVGDADPTRGRKVRRRPAPRLDPTLYEL